ncbi:hypothetical protein F2P81_009618 [Scophthalmus maximus]|uniref:DUF659 domain-containing protein n=1 Tax=Scophthalmus maximus TaxID=52904 RepID=A0A6A4T7F4_SCOMX|nr:hypothetical protein F2P81_009618 [Scophthalmus maximus]
MAQSLNPAYSLLSSGNLSLAVGGKKLFISHVAMPSVMERSGAGVLSRSRAKTVTNGNSQPHSEEESSDEEHAHGNTTNLRTHLVRRHADTIKLQQQPTPVDPRQTTLDDTTNKFSSTSSRAVKITESVVLFICHDLRPYSVVENTGFRYMVNTMEPRYVIPTRKHITEVAVPRMYEEVKQVVKTSLGSAERVALTCDGWTWRATESYVTITSHHINQEWKLSHVLQTRAMHESHTGSNIAELLKRALEE